MFQIGEMVYVAGIEGETKWETCPVCAGQKFVTLILGSGEQVQLACDYCYKDNAYEPTGVIDAGGFIVARVERRCITGIDYRQDRDTTIWFGGQGASMERCSYNYEEALQKAEAYVEKHNREKFEERNSNFKKFRAGKSYSWNAGYYKRELEHAKRNVEFYEKALAYMQSKIKIEKK